MNELPAVTLRKKLEQHLSDLPVLPTAIVQLMQLNLDDDDYVDQVVRVVEAEPNFSARLIAAANSAASAPVAPITSLRAAIVRLGARNASGLVVALAVARVFVPRDAWEKSLWRHALHVAVTARLLSRCAVGVSLDADACYTCGLLHDVGRFVLFEEAPEQLRKIDEGEWETPQQLVELERTLCGLTHTELGGLACAKWHMPELITAVVREHHSPSPRGLPPLVEHVVALVRFADVAMFSSAIPGAPGLDAADDATLERFLLSKLPPFLRMGPAELRALLQTGAATATASAQALGIV